MTAAPEVSVVMGVFNGGSSLARTVESVLTQEDISLELIIVNDGSTDETAQVLASAAARDSRVRVLTQPNQGLTRALIAGCDAATGEYIARQDAGDTSLPGRLATQCAVLQRSSATVLVSCFTRFVGIYGEGVFESRITASELRAGLWPEDAGGLRGPNGHPSVMVRAAAYRRVGGYRKAFPVAQDTDLWLRLAEVGEVDVVPEVLYEAELSPGGISALRRPNQLEYARLALLAAKARRAGQSDSEEVAPESLAVWASRESRASLAWRRAGYLYFVGRCHARRDPTVARLYYRAALAACPWHWRSAVALTLAAVAR